MENEKTPIVIVTRRFNNYSGLGTIGKPHKLDKTCKLFQLWCNEGFKNISSIKPFWKKNTDVTDDDDVKKYLATLSSTDFSKYRKVNTSHTIEEIFTVKKAELWLEGYETLQFLFEKQDNGETKKSYSKQTEKDSEKADASYYHLLNIVEPTNNIYVFAHFPVKEFTIGKIKFLPALRADIMKLLKDKNPDKEENQYQLYWLIHDSDILRSNYDGLLYDGRTVYHPDAYLNLDDLNDLQKQVYEKQQKKEDNKHIPDADTILKTIEEDSTTKANEFIESNIPNELRNDYICCFIHNEDASDNYKKLILSYTDSITADVFAKKLFFDVESCKRRMIILDLFNKADSFCVNEKDIAFIVQGYESFWNSVAIGTVTTLGQLKEKLTISDHDH